MSWSNWRLSVVVVFFSMSLHCFVVCCGRDVFFWYIYIVSFLFMFFDSYSCREAYSNWIVQKVGERRIKSTR